MALKTDSLWQLFAFSGVASCCAELATVPIDVTKTRLQLSGELGAATKYKGALDAVRTIVREEGLAALYKGVQPALLRQATYGSLRIGLYEPIKTALVEALPVSGGPLPAPGAAAPPALLHKLLAGVLCGGMASAMCTPTDVVKVRMMADTSVTNPRYRNVFHAFGAIYRAEGATGLYRGVSPTVQRAAVVAAVELASYDECKSLLMRWAGLPPGSMWTHLGASLMAGFLCTLASSPLDVIKSRVMNQPVDASGRGLTYSSTVDCFRKAVKAEGVMSLWKGFWPNFGAYACDSVGGGGSVALPHRLFIVASTPTPRFSPSQPALAPTALSRSWSLSSCETHSVPPALPRRSE
jgi:hypothetical protein